MRSKQRKFSCLKAFVLVRLKGGGNYVACCHYHYHRCWYPEEYVEPYPRRRRFVRSTREDELSELEEERDNLERRLRKLEKELEELRQRTSEKHD
jgi:hypothetical protein